MAMRFGLALVAGLCWAFGSWQSASGAEEVGSLRFREVYDAVRTNLFGINEAELDREAAAGLIEQLAPRVQLLVDGEGGAATNGPSLTRATVYDGSFGYVRVGTVGAGLAKEFERAYAGLSRSNRLKGMVVDLRFADGENYAAAAELADRFFATEQPLVEADGVAYKSTVKEGAVLLPVAILVNERTGGAAEVVAGALRQNGVGLILGARTAGRAMVYRVVELETGQRLRLAVAPVRVARDRLMPTRGLIPDIEVKVSADAEKVYYEDPFAAVPRSGGRPGRAIAGLGEPPRSEAELLRSFREGLEPGAVEAPVVPPPEPVKPVLRDPVLARGIDLLKGLAVVQQFREI